MNRDRIDGFSAGAAIAILSLLIGCRPMATHGEMLDQNESMSVLEYLERDSWHNPEDIGFTLDEATEVPFWEISVSSLGFAEDVLADTTIVPVTDELLGTADRAEILGVKGIEVPTSNSLYLVRALYYVGETGGFVVFFEDGNLLVRHECLADSPQTMKRSALLVALPGFPKTVSVDPSIAE